MKLIFALFVLYSGSLFANPAPTPKPKVTVAYFGRLSDEEFNMKIKPVFADFCKDCEIVNSTPYDKDKKVDDSKLAETVNQLGENIQIVFFDWNDKSTAQPEALVEGLQKLKSRRQMLVASAGAPTGDGPTCPLGQTVFGKVEDAIIVGELMQRDILWPKCFYGPEMLTAVRPPKDLMGKGVGPLIFTAKFAAQYNKRTPDEWTQFFRSKKSKSRKIWPELEEFFPR
jgi:hypothetical protein